MGKNISPTWTYVHHGGSDKKGPKVKLKPKKIQARIDSKKSRVREIVQQKYYEHGRCCWCDCVLNDKNLSTEHIKPIDRGGNNSKHNIDISCVSCNNKKGNMRPDLFAQTVRGVTDIIDMIVEVYEDNRYCFDSDLPHEVNLSSETVYIWAVRRKYPAGKQLCRYLLSMGSTRFYGDRKLKTDFD
jgi:5-methylcytosine-specific restriction endonuclease McrA